MAIATLHLTNAYHPCSGGIRTMYEALLAQAEREGRRMALVVPSDADRVQRVGRTTLIHHVRAPHAPAFDRRYRTLLPHRFLPPGSGRLWEILDAEQPDLVEVCDKHSLCYFAGLIRKRRQRRGEGPTLVGLSCERLDDNVRVHLTSHALGAQAARTFLRRVYIGMFDAHIANSTYTAEELHAAMAPPHLRPVYVGLMGVDIPGPLGDDERAAVRDAVRRELALPSAARILTYAGRLSPEKHADGLVEVAARVAYLGSAQLVVAGDGPSRASLELACKARGAAAVRFLGHLDTTALRRLLAASDLFVHPNPCEPFGIGPLEAMAAGIPIVAPRSGGILSYASDDNAWLTGVSGSELADGVQRALMVRTEWAQKAKAARRTAEQFHWPEAAARLFRTYDMIHTVHAFDAGRKLPVVVQEAAAADALSPALTNVNPSSHR